MIDKIKMEVPYFQVPNKIFDLNLDKLELLVYLYLCRCANNSNAFPSYKTIAEKCCMHRDTAIKTVKKLIQKKLIIKHLRVIKTDNKKHNESNVYEIVTNLDNYFNNNGSSSQLLGVVVDNDQGSSSQLLGVVVDNDQGSSSQLLGVVVDNDQGSSCERPYKELKDKELKDKELIINENFEKLWFLYPFKRGKGSIKKATKEKIFEIGFEKMKLAIERYIKDTELRREVFPEMNYKNGSTFFNSGYLDFIDNDFEFYKPDIKPKQNNKPIAATNYEQREYDDDFWNEFNNRKEEF